MPPLKPSTILVVDDDEDDQFLIHQILKRHTTKADIQRLFNGEELLSWLVQSPAPPDLVLLDLNMPRLGGLETLQAIRQQAPYQQLPVVILTTSDSAADRHEAGNLQASDYLVKPASIEELNRLLLGVITRWL